MGTGIFLSFYLWHSELHDLWDDLVSGEATGLSWLKCSSFPNVDIDAHTQGGKQNLTDVFQQRICMTGILVPDLLRPWLLPALDAADICFLCSASRRLREELKWLRSFSVKFSRELSVDDDAIESLGQTIRAMPCLRHLSACFAYHGSSTLCCMLAKSLSGLQLVELALDIRHCNLGDQGIRAWTKTIAQQHSLTFLQLRLSFNRISSKGAHDLANAFKQFGSSVTDVVLDVDINPIGVGAVSLLESLRVPRLRLDMAHCGIGDVVAQELASILESFAECTESLELDLRGNCLTESKVSIVKATACLNAAGCKCLSRLD